KKELFAIATTASSASYLDYSEESLIALREKYAEALKLYFSGTATASQIQATAKELTTAYNNSLATVISVGKSYTTTKPNRNDGDQNNDDGSRLTNGAKCVAGAGTNAYSGWSSGVNPEITVDLGSSMSSDTYTVYAASMASWGIPAPSSVNVKVSSNGSTWTDLGTCKDITYRQSDSTTGTGKTNYYSFTVKASSVQNARYVKFTVDGGNHTWIDEVEVALSNKNAGKAIENAIYINGVNRVINAGDCHVFTPAFGTVTPDKANTNYSATVVLTSTSAANQYTVKSITFNNGSAADYTLASNEILLVCHSDSAVPGSLLSLKTLQTVKAGDKLNVFGVDAAESALGIAAYASPATESAGGSETSSNNVALGKEYTTSTLYSSNGSTADYPDETGKTMTDGVNATFNGTYSDPAFIGFNKSTSDYVANGYASITVDLGKKYDLDKFVAKVASSLNKVSGITAPATVSVFVSNDNKTWTEAGSVEPIDNPTFSTVDAVVELDKAVCARYVQYRFVGSSNWIMVAEVEAYGIECDDADTDVTLGDVNGNGKVDSLDYLLVKRACFKTYTLSEAETLRADVNRDSKIDSSDYLLVKRIAFGTYKA
ncbi:MAG: discoidin domain-containing protein, partial [Clostridia bacterium]|nr:discoidin domain-containing protein [Clostridia bacterium]